MDELLDGLWRWTARHPEFHPKGFPEVASFALRDDVGTILVDPLAAGGRRRSAGGARSRIVARARAHPDHRPVPRAQLGGAVAALPRALRDHDPRPPALHQRGCRTTAGFRPFGDAPVIDGDIVPNSPSAARAATSTRCGCRPTARWRSATRSSRWTASCGCGTSPSTASRRRRWYEDRYLPTLEALLDHDVERVLVTHGEPVLQGGRRALEAAFAQPPWHRDKGGG